MTTTTTAADPAVWIRQLEIERFYYDEAAMLDDSRYTEWLDLLTDDAVYLMPQREFADRRTNRALDEVGAHLLSENRRTLEVRAAWLMGPPTPETPRPFRRTLITNVRVTGETDGALEVHSRFLHWEYTSAGRGATFIGAREDLLRSTPAGFRIARRLILLDTPLLPKAPTTFF